MLSSHDEMRTYKYSKMFSIFLDLLPPPSLSISPLANSPPSLLSLNRTYEYHQTTYMIPSILGNSFCYVSFSYALLLNLLIVVEDDRDAVLLCSTGLGILVLLLRFSTTLFFPAVVKNFIISHRNSQLQEQFLLNFPNDGEG